MIAIIIIMMMMITIIVKIIIITPDKTESLRLIFFIHLTVLRLKCFTQSLEVSRGRPYYSHEK